MLRSRARAPEIELGLAVAAFDLGVVLEHSGRASALAACGRAIAADSPFADAQCNLAPLAEHSGQCQVAFRQASRYRPLLREVGRER